MRSRYRIFEKRQAHFITGTIVAWLPIFTTAPRCDILVRALEYCRAQKDLQIHGWVILDNHFHSLPRRGGPSPPRPIFPGCWPI